MRLLTDAMLGTLTTHLRVAGHDTAYALDRGIEDDEAVLAAARAEGRRLLTRDRALAARAPDPVLLTARDLEAQLAELADGGLDLSVPERPVRCGACNGRLEAVPADGATPEYAPDPGGRFRVWRCLDCDQHFWKGSHWAAMRERLDGV